jgi:hypothetical protein
MRSGLNNVLHDDRNILMARKPGLIYQVIQTKSFSIIQVIL